VSCAKHNATLGIEFSTTPKRCKRETLKKIKLTLDFNTRSY